jgi:5'-nucleotidase
MNNLLKVCLLCLFIGQLQSCQNEPNLQKIKAENIQIESGLEESEALNAFIKPYRSSIEGEMNKPLSYSPKAMFKNDTPYNTAIGNLMADAVLDMANPVFKSRHGASIDAVLLNHGSIRAGINKGIVTTRTAYNIMPFENKVVVAKLRGDQVKAMFEYLAKAKRAHPIANMNIVVDDNWNLKSYTINGKTVDNSQNYHIATSDYLVNGGDNMNFFQKADSIYQTDYKVRNVLIDYFKKTDTLKAKADQRFKNIHHE